MKALLCIGFTWIVWDEQIVTGTRLTHFHYWDQAQVRVITVIAAGHWTEHTASLQCKDAVQIEIVCNMWLGAKMRQKSVTNDDLNTAQT